MDSTISGQPKDVRNARLEAFFREIRARVLLSEQGEIYITWKGSSVQMKYSQWLSGESLTNGQKR